MGHVAERVHGFAPDALEVFALKLGALIDNQVFGPFSPNRRLANMDTGPG